MKTLGIGIGLAVLGLAALTAGRAAAADQDLDIGVVAAESGSFVSAGNTIVAAAKLAAAKINDAGGIHVGDKTYKIKLHIRDNRTDVNVTIAAALELVNDVGVKAIWGTETHDFLDRHGQDHGPRSRCFNSPETVRSAARSSAQVRGARWLAPLRFPN